jgi:MFS family permease
VTDRQTAFSSLRHRDFRLLWIGQIVSVTGSQMQLAAINWHIYLLTGSALSLGLVGACRAVPIILCSLAGGVVADVVDRRRLMMATQSVMLLCSATLALVTWRGLAHVWPIFLLTAIASAAWAFDTPARQALMPALVPLKDFPNAVSLSMLMFQVGLIVGPPLSGFVLASHGPTLVYTINAVSFVAVIVGLALMRTSGRPEQDESNPQRISFDALLERPALCPSHPDHCPDDDAGFRRDVLRVGKSVAADLCQRYSQSWRAGVWVFSRGPGRRSSSYRVVNGQIRDLEETRTTGPRIDRGLWRGYDWIRFVASFLVVVAAAGGDGCSRHG